MRAALRGHRDVVDYLLSSGADPALQNSRHSTARQLAKNKGHADVVEVFQNFADSSQGKPSKKAAI